MKKLLSAFLFILFSYQAVACINLYVVDEHGREGIYDGYPVYRIYSDPKHALDALRLNEKFIKEGGADRYRWISDYAANLMKLGRNKEALTILRKLVIQHPREYQILSNVATAFELNGMPDSALVYMKRSLMISMFSKSKRMIRVSHIR